MAVGSGQDECELETDAANPLDRACEVGAILKGQRYPIPDTRAEGRLDHCAIGAEVQQRSLVHASVAAEVHGAAAFRMLSAHADPGSRADLRG